MPHGFRACQYRGHAPAGQHQWSEENTERTARGSYSPPRSSNYPRLRPVVRHTPSIAWAHGRSAETSGSIYFAFENAAKALHEQLGRLESLDAKAGVLLAADGVLAGLLFATDSGRSFRAPSGWTRPGSNRLPPPCHGGALPSELRALEDFQGSKEGDCAPMRRGLIRPSQPQPKGGAEWTQPP